MPPKTKRRKTMNSLSTEPSEPAPTIAVALSGSGAGAGIGRSRDKDRDKDKDKDKDVPKNTGIGTPKTHLLSPLPTSSNSASPSPPALVSVFTNRPLPRAPNVVEFVVSPALEVERDNQETLPPLPLNKPDLTLTLSHSAPAATSTATLVPVPVQSTVLSLSTGITHDPVLSAAITKASAIQQQQQQNQQQTNDADEVSSVNDEQDDIQLSSNRQNTKNSSQATKSDDDDQIDDAESVGTRESNGSTESLAMNAFGKNDLLQQQDDEDGRQYGNMPAHLRVALMRKRNQIPRRRKNNLPTAVSQPPPSVSDAQQTSNPPVHQEGLTHTIETLDSITTSILASSSSSSEEYLPQSPSITSTLQSAITELKLLQSTMSGHATQYFDLREKELSFKTRQIDQVLSDPTEPTVSLLKTNYASNKATSKATYQSAKAYIEAVYQGSLKAAEETYLMGRRQIRDELNEEVKRKLAELEGERWRDSVVQARDSDLYMGTRFDRPVKRSWDDKMSITRLCEPMDQDAIDSDISYLKLMTNGTI